MIFRHKTLILTKSLLILELFAAQLIAIFSTVYYSYETHLSSEKNPKTRRLMAEKISKMERKNEAQINMMYQGNETEEFWNLLGGYREDFQPEVTTSPNPFIP